LHNEPLIDPDYLEGVDVPLASGGKLTLVGWPGPIEVVERLGGGELRV